MTDLFDKTEVRMSARQAQILLDLLRDIDMSNMTAEDVMTANGLYYSLEAAKDKIKLTQQYECPSFINEDGKVIDCSCGGCK